MRRILGSLLVSMILLSGCACQHEHWGSDNNKWIHPVVRENWNTPGVVNVWGNFKPDSHYDAYWCDTCHHQVATCEFK